ncbi:MAG: hypothetical protein HQK77_05375 [Desulfobacterales bacterium]|nr:hypothetical protein [Desulfobacterales bacterium]
MEHTSSKNIAAALKILEDAAEQKKEELMSVMSDKYTNLRSLIIDNESSIMKSLNTAKDHAFVAAVHVKDAGVDKAREIVYDVDKGVHHNPWPYIAGSAFVGFFFGYVLRQNHN